MVGVLEKRLIELKQKQKKKKRSHIPVRMNILFFSVFVLFSILILRLGVLQIVHGEEYRKQVERKDEISVDFSVPRGEMLDRYYRKVVRNIPLKAITYTPPRNPQPMELYEVAEKLGQLIVMSEADMKRVTERDKKDLWILLNDNGNEKITDEEFEKFKAKELDDRDIYRMKLDRITESDLATLDMNVAAIYRKLSTAIALTPTIVKNEGVTDQEFALVSENLAELPGVDVTTDWNREKVYGNTMTSVLGSFSEGLRSENKDYYLAKGYSLNDRVGTSYLEALYEEVLQGSKSKVKTVTDKQGNVIETEVISEGKSGKNIVLTIDMELQAEIEKIIEEEILKMKAMPRTETLDQAFVVVMDPKTGEVLSLAGKMLNKDGDAFLDFSRGTFTQTFEMGSTVKAATMLTGYETGVINIGDRKLDSVLDIKGTKSKRSWKTLGMVNDLQALEMSSNIYMWRIAIDIMEGNYIPGASLPLNTSKIEDIRYYFSQFGLGVKTGIGFKEEEEGIKGTNEQVYIDIAIGQLDTYTPLQLAQYISTIANDGYRMKPLIVKEIREPDVTGEGFGTIVEMSQPQVLNRVDMDSEYIERVQQGLWRVTNGSQGTARYYFANEPYNIAGKTGTAESFHYDTETRKLTSTYNLTFVGYAPFENPEIAISVVVPYAYQGKSPYSIANYISQRVFRTYFELKQSRQIDESTGAVIDKAENEGELEEEEAENELNNEIDNENNEETESE